MRPDIQAAIEREVAAITIKHPAYRSSHLETPPALKSPTASVLVGARVYVHGSGHWRPGIVERRTRRGSEFVYTVMHATPTRPTTIRRKRVRLDGLRLLKRQQRRP